MTEARQPLAPNFDVSADDFAHPQYEQLAALVDDQLDAADREWVTSHVELCGVCREDVNDLIEVKASLLTAEAPGLPVTASSHPRMKQAIGIAAIAAGVIFVIWLGVRTPPSADVAPQATSSPTVSQHLSPVVTAPASILTPDEERRERSSLESGQIEWPSFAALLRGHSGTLLGAKRAASTFAPTSPTGTATLDRRPTFSWTTLDHATSYSVAVFDERFNEVASSGPLRGTSWTPTRDLPTGRILAWQVTATTPGGTVLSPAPPQPEARLLVLDAATTADIAMQRTRLSSSPVALALALTRVGLFSDAERALESALVDSQYNPTQVRALLAQLRARGAGGL